MPCVPTKGIIRSSIVFSDANSNYNGLQLYAAKRKGNLELTASYTWSKALTDTSGNGDGFGRGRRFHSIAMRTMVRPRLIAAKIFVTTYDYRLPFFSKMKGVGALSLRLGSQRHYALPKRSILHRYW